MWWSAEMCPKFAKACCCGSAASPARSKKTITAKLTTAGFENIDIEPTRIYRIEDARAFLTNEESVEHRRDCSSGRWQIYERFREGDQTEAPVLWPELLCPRRSSKRVIKRQLNRHHSATNILAVRAYGSDLGVGLPARVKRVQRP